MDAVSMIERWHWTWPEIDETDWDDFCLSADVIAEIKKIEAKHAADAARGRG